MEYVNKYAIELNFASNLIKVDGPAKKAWFSEKNESGQSIVVEKDFEMLHVCPVQGPQDCLVDSQLTNADGWVEVNQKTMQHVKFSNVFAVGDCCSTPNSKTAAAARKQIVVASENLMSLQKGSELGANYDGYGSCPLTVERGRIVLAEFGYGGKLLPTFPWLINPVKPTRMAWFLKKTMLPIIYWHGMLKGREWFTKTVEN
jgi:sulfide:quinone oxidoreductase